MWRAVTAGRAQVVGAAAPVPGDAGADVRAVRVQRAGDPVGVVARGEPDAVLLLAHGEDLGRRRGPGHLLRPPGPAPRPAPGTPPAPARSRGRTGPRVAWAEALRSTAQSSAARRHSPATRPPYSPPPPGVSRALGHRSGPPPPARGPVAGVPRALRHVAQPQLHLPPRHPVPPPPPAPRAPRPTLSPGPPHIRECRTRCRARAVPVPCAAAGIERRFKRAASVSLEAKEI